MFEYIGPDQALFGFLGSVAFLTLLFMYAFYYLIKREREIRNREQQLDKKATTAIEKSHRKARDILTEAVDNAKSILADTKTFQKALEGDVQNTIDKEKKSYNAMLQQQLKNTVGVYNQILSEVAVFYKDSIKDATSKLKDSQKQQEQDYKNMVEDESLTAKFYIQRRVNEELEKANKEIKDYKESELSHVRKQFEIIIDEISERIFEGSLTPQQHEDLIFRALEEAKKKRIFTG